MLVTKITIKNLSTRRAESVSSILAQNDVSRSRIKAYGRGELEPAMSNKPQKVVHQIVE